MKVLLITDNHTLSGGAEQYFFTLKNYLKAVPDIEVYSLGFGPAETKGEDFFIFKAAKSNVAKLIWRSILHPFMYKKLKQTIQTIQPDLIHIHNIKQYSPSLLRAIKSYPTVQTMHDFSFVCPTAQNIHKDFTPCRTGMRMQCFWQHRVKFNPFIYLVLSYSFFKLRKLLQKNIQAFTAPSPILQAYLEKNNFANVKYIPPFTSEKKPYSFAERQTQHFLFAGNLGTHKGVYLLLEEFKKACEKNPNLFLSIAGTGPEEAKIQDYCHQLNIEKNIQFLGWQTDLTPYYNQATAVIFPSIGMESFGLVITEAMGHARPVIGINRGTSAWLIHHNETGLLFDAKKSGDLADQILTLANQPDLSQQLGINAYEKLDKLFTNNKTLDEVMAVYKEVIALK